MPKLKFKRKVAKHRRHLASGKSTIVNKNMRESRVKKILKQGNIPAPFKAGDIVQFKYDIYQNSDSGLFDIWNAIEKEHKSEEFGNLFERKAGTQIRGGISNAKQYESYAKEVVNSIMRKKRFYFKLVNGGEKAIIITGVNQNDIILERLDGDTFGAFDKSFVKHLTRLKK